MQNLSANSLDPMAGFLEKVSDINAASLSNPHYVKNLRELLRIVIETRNGYKVISSSQTVTLADQLMIDHLLRDLNQFAREIDELICEASLQVTFELKISSQVLRRLVSKIKQVESTFTNLEKFSKSEA